MAYNAVKPSEVPVNRKHAVMSILFSLSFSTSAFAASATARAKLMDAAGKTVGDARLTETEKGVELTIEATGLTPGKHGFHIHQTGTCTPPDFKSAGGHYNPTGKKHGAQNSEGPHHGDLPNLEAAADGKAKVTFSLKGVTLKEGENELFDKDGAAIVIHAKPDDLKSDPAGNAGDRVACGVLALER